MKPPKHIRFRNVSEQYKVVLRDLDISCAPGEECSIEEGYAFPRRSHAGGRFPSVIEQLAGCPGCDKHTHGKHPDGGPNHLSHCMLVPVDEADVERFASVPGDEDTRPRARAKMPSVADFVSMGVPRGVAEQLVKAALATSQGGGLEMETEAPKAVEKAPSSEKPAPAKK